MDSPRQTWRNLKNVWPGNDYLWVPVGLFIFHILLALYLHFGFGVNIEADLDRPWDWFWQTVDLSLLKSEPVTSLWNLHSVPPLHNGIMAVLLKLSTNGVQMLHLVHILAGACFAPMIYTIMRKLRIDPRLAFPVAMAVTIDPGLLLFEAYLLYDLLTAFLVIVTVYLLCSYLFDGHRWLLPAFVLSVTLLALERSSFHFIIVIAAALLAIFLASGWRRNMTVWALIVTLPLTVVVIKNDVKFHFLGTSSWLGLSLFKVGTSAYPKQEMEAFATSKGIPSYLIELPPFSPPSLYPPGSYQTTSTVAVLNNDDFHNIGIVRISAHYKRAGLMLIRNNPSYYLKSVKDSYFQLCKPTVLYKHLAINGDKIAPYRNLFAQYIEGGWLAASNPERRWLQSYYSLLIPLVLMIAPIVGFVRVLRKTSRESGVAILVISGFCIYVITTSCLLETYEGDRYKLYFQYLLWLLTTYFVSESGRKIWSLFRQY